VCLPRILPLTVSRRSTPTAAVSNDIGPEPTDRGHRHSGRHALMAAEGGPPETDRSGPLVFVLAAGV
jgi:hypothetical protein